MLGFMSLYQYQQSLGYYLIKFNELSETQIKYYKHVE